MRFFLMTSAQSATLLRAPPNVSEEDDRRLASVAYYRSGP